MKANKRKFCWNRRSSSQL